MSESGYYAAWLRLDGCRCVVVGGGRVAERKIGKLLQSGAKVTVISPAVTPRIQQWSESGRVTWHERGYGEGDIAGARIVFAATDDRALNRRVFAAADAAGKWVNVADDATLCTFLVPAVYRRKHLQIAISTLGTAPQTAKRLRLLLENDVAQGTQNFQKEVLSFEELGRDGDGHGDGHGPHQCGE